MNISYCDLCSVPIKGTNYYALYITSPDITAPDRSKYESQEEYNGDYVRYLSNVAKDIKEVCPTCYHIFNEIFKHRLQGMSKLTEECQELFNLPTKCPSPYKVNNMKIKLTTKDIDNLLQDKKIVKKYFSNTIELEMK